MSSFAFVVPPFVGHTNPTVAVGKELAQRGHEVAWIGHAETTGPLLPPQAKLVSLDIPITATSDLVEKVRMARGFESLRVLYQDILCPLARATLPGVQAAVDSLKPDVLIVDQQAFAGAMVARRTGLRWASFATTSAMLTSPFSSIPKVKDWIDSKVAELQTEAGLPVVRDGEISPSLLVVFTTEALVGSTRHFPEHYRFVGPSLAPPRQAEFPFDELLDDRKKVLVSLGTVSIERRDGFFDKIVEAFGDDPTIQIVLVAPPEILSRPPPPGARMIIRPRVPQLALLPRLDAVVCHSGHNTVCETLSNGLPLVVLPIRDDQPVIAQQVVDAACGIRLRYGRVPSAILREAVHRVLEEPSFGEAARRIRASFLAAGGAPRAASLLEELAS